MSGEPGNLFTLFGLSEPALLLRMVELVLAVSLLELLWFVLRSGPLARRQGLPNLLAGLSLILALRLGLGGAGFAWVAACLLAAGVSHLLDLQARQRIMQEPEANHRSPHHPPKPLGPGRQSP